MPVQPSGFPSAWTALCRFERSLKRTSAAEGFKQLNRAAARYRVASSFEGMRLKRPASSGIAAGYSSGIRLLLSYSAYESARRSIKALGVSNLARTRTSLYRSAASGIREHMQSDVRARQLLQCQVDSPRLRQEVTRFVLGDDEELFAVATALRHLIAHGNWTPFGGGGQTVRARRALAQLSDYLLVETSSLFDRALAHLEWQSGAGRGSNSTLPIAPSNSKAKRR